MTIAQVITSLPSSGEIDKALLRSAILSGLVHFIAPDIDPQTVDPVDSDTGAKVWLIGWQEKFWWLDPTDSTTAHDAVTCIVLDGGGRYKVSDVDPWHGYSVLSADEDTPPDPDDSPGPAYGDAYLVPGGASGDWGDHADDIAIWTARGWAYVPPRFGRLLYVKDQKGYVHYTADGEWAEGLGNNAHADDSISPDKLIQGLTHWIVEQNGLNTPPSIVKGVNYVVGNSPTGAWVGHTNDIATSNDGSTWEFYTPAEGWTIYDKTLNINSQWDGSAWVSQAGAIVGAAHQYTAGNGTTSNSGNTGSGSGAAYSSGTPPTTSHRRLIDGVTISYAAKKSGARLRFNYSCKLNGTTNNSASSFPSAATQHIITLFRDSESSGIKHFSLGTTLPGSCNIVFDVTAPDTSSHTYTVAITAVSAGSSLASDPNAMETRDFSLLEFA